MEKLLRQIYLRFNPDLIESIPHLLSKYKGSEDVLLSEICKKYGITEDLLQELQNATESESSGNFEFETGDSSSLHRVRNFIRPISIIVFVLIVVLLLIKMYKSDEDVLLEDRIVNSDVVGSLREFHFSYAVKSDRAFFYIKPDFNTKKKSFLVPSSYHIIARDFQNGFIYTVFTNTNGQTSSGWIAEDDLIPVAAIIPDASVVYRTGNIVNLKGHPELVNTSTGEGGPVWNCLVLKLEVPFRFESYDGSTQVIKEISIQGIGIDNPLLGQLDSIVVTGELDVAQTVHDCRDVVLYFK